MKKSLVVEKEKMKLIEIFIDIDDKQKKLVESLIDEAAFLVGENFVLKELIEKVGSVRFNPDNPAQQKQTPASAQYLKNLNSYTIVIKTLNSILMKQSPEEDDDELSDYE